MKRTADSEDGPGAADETELKKSKNKHKKERHRSRSEGPPVDAEVGPASKTSKRSGKMVAHLPNNG